jgi:hypothetical protein
VEEPQDQYCSRDDEHAEDLIASKCAPLDFSPFVFGDVLIVRLDAAFNHVVLGIILLFVAGRGAGRRLRAGTASSSWLPPL